MNTTRAAHANSATTRKQRRYPIGAEIIGGCVSFRVWAPANKYMSVLLESDHEHAMRREVDGYFRLDMDGLAAGSLYRFKLESSAEPVADPASRFQPDGPTGPSMVIDPNGFSWRDHDWPGIAPNGQVLYEMHIGTFTPEGSYAAAAEKLPLLKEIGITCVELMPVNEFYGVFG